ncbi:SDR family NAD(P)-dependent oxidoreductase [Flavobacterium hungaricum]|uniref:SDR family NAD(P)-dependent oxidoreductase n=1 Tax=Flavobacterium hungaricum TaxID=2082725 RepID=A0ABR9TM53_9FLAO|nr:SDR family NAD(P)-dependent oxidoreductase [Flavobacterium hungaricum]MBE8726433.1 SDR family NAD(P)-dependent oxidoreductase [Flavobacterium hungaricum]
MKVTSNLRILKLLFILLFISILTTSCTTWKVGTSGQKKIASKTYVIIGASSGMGRGIAQQLGKYKANVVLAARRTNLLEEVADTIRKSGGKAVVVTIDISKEEDLQRVKEAALKEYSKIDVWINMAGITAIGRFWEVPIEDQMRVIDVNLKGFFYSSRTAVNLFIKQGEGVLINVASVMGEIPLAYQSGYSATKAGVRSLDLALSQELRLNGYDKIKVVTIEPWAVDTPIWRHAANYTGVEPKMAMMDEPQKIVNAVLRKSLRPKKIVPVGWKAQVSSFSANVFPRFSERLGGNMVEKYMIETGPETPNTQGSIYEPIPEGRGVDDGAKKRMKEYKKNKKK